MLSDDDRRPPNTAYESGAGAPTSPPVIPAVAAPEAPVSESQLESIQSPTHLHPTSLVFDLIAHGRTYLVPILFGLFGAANGNVTLLVISGLVFIPAVLVSVVRYFTLRYRIESKHLVVTQGVLFRKTRTVPVARIQNIDLVQNLLHRAFGVAEVRIETASGTEPEATLRVLSMSQLEILRQAVFADQQQLQAGPARGTEPAELTGLPSTASAEAADGSVEVASQASPDAVPVLRIDLGDLLKAGLASNRGLVIAGIAVGAIFQFGGDQFDDQWEQMVAWLPDHLPTGSMVPVAIVGVLAVLLLLRLLGIAWYLSRFFDYRLDRRGDDLRISCGLLTRVSATVPRRRVQFVSVHRSLFMRWFGLAAIRIETAGGSGEQQNATESVSKRWFVPVIRESRVRELVELLRPGLSWDEAGLDFQPLAGRALARMLRVAILLTLIVTAVGGWVAWPWGLLAGPVALGPLVLWSRRQARAMRYARVETGVVYRSGVINRKISITFYDKIQTMTVDQSPFDRRWKMARLSVDTAAAGPAGHQISIPYLDAEFAQREFELLRERAGQTRPVFQ